MAISPGSATRGRRRHGPEGRRPRPRVRRCRSPRGPWDRPRGRLDGLTEVLWAVDLADAQGGAGASGLDEQGVGQGPAGLQDRLGSRFQVWGPTRRAVPWRCPRPPGAPCDLLVHASGTGQHPTADVGKAHHLQHALDGPVLAVGPVQQRQDDIDPPQDLRPRGAEHRELTASQGCGECPASQTVGGDGHQRPAVAELEGGRIVLDEQPLPPRG